MQNCIFIELNMLNKRMVCKVRDSTCAFKNHPLVLHRCTGSPACLHYPTSNNTAETHKWVPTQACCTADQPCTTVLCTSTNHVSNHSTLTPPRHQGISVEANETPDSQYKHACIHKHTHTPQHWWLPSSTSHVHNMNMKALVLHFLGIFPHSYKSKGLIWAAMYIVAACDAVCLGRPAFISENMQSTKTW